MCVCDYVHICVTVLQLSDYMNVTMYIMMMCIIFSSQS